MGLAGCGKSEEEMEAVAADLAGVMSVRASQEPGDGLPFVTQFPADVRVTMEERSTEGEILDVTASYDEEVEDGDVERLSVVLQGEPRATLTASGGVIASAEMVQDLLAARDDPALVRYQLEASPLGRSVEVSLASGALDEVVAAVAGYRQDDDVTRVTVRSGHFTLSVDDTTWEVDLSDERVRLIRDVHERFGLHEAVVAYPDSMGLWVDAADVTSVRRLVDSRRTGYAYVKAFTPGRAGPQ